MRYGTLSRQALRMLLTAQHSILSLHPEQLATAEAGASYEKYFARVDFVKVVMFVCW